MKLSKKHRRQNICSIAKSSTNGWTAHSLGHHRSIHHIQVHNKLYWNILPRRTKCSPRGRITTRTADPQAYLLNTILLYIIWLRTRRLFMLGATPDMLLPARTTSSIREQDTHMCLLPTISKSCHFRVCMCVFYIRCILCEINLRIRCMTLHSWRVCLCGDLWHSIWRRTWLHAYRSGRRTAHGVMFLPWSV